ncbi:hypothetical protein NDU88_004038 [Pleurodeles waltl]|uniref:Uncharacterized protein n=1 Tax=Pleurodeles waltl TaxID=8319 RepID=A0AAV7RFY6_PLEWA|nr:hypothetical protein NDU88_004038 [Pleurodeles waltl]
MCGGEVMGEETCKDKQKLGLWSLRKQKIKGKSLVLRNEILPVLQYVAQVWRSAASTAKAIARMIFYFIWNSKMDTEEGGVIQDTRQGRQRSARHRYHPKGSLHVPLHKEHPEDKRRNPHSAF